MPTSREDGFPSRSICGWLVAGLLAVAFLQQPVRAEENLEAEQVEAGEEVETGEAVEAIEEVREVSPEGAMRIEDAGPREMPEIEPSPLVDRLLDDALTTDAQRQRLRVFHGRWDDLDEAALPVALRAELALLRGQYWAEVWTNEEVPQLLRARAAVRRYDRAEALRLLDDPAEAAEAGTLAQVLYLRGWMQLRDGRQAEAIESLSPLRELLRRVQLTDPAELTATARGLALLARMEGTPAQDHHTAMGLLAKARELDPLHWPAMIAEGELLASKGNREEAAQALVQAVSLNPRAADAWFGLGRMSAMTFNFDAAGDAQRRLEQIDAEHPLAHRLRLLTLIRQKDTDAATELVRELEAEERFAAHADLHALFAAVDGLAYRRAEMRERLEALDRQSAGEGTGRAMPYFIVGEALSFARQYDVAEEMLLEAVAREPNWAEPRVALGLLLMQWGDLPAARKALRHAERLDPFHIRAANQLRLVEELVDEYATLETEQFIIRYKPGLDEVLARDMAAELDAMHREVADAFEHDPAVKTQIDLMPDTERFAVRITGLPDIWTIAAATGDVIALTPPRVGQKQHGSFDWPVVLRHEYVHTVTLGRTANRIPHWYTEACAVWQEPNPRSFGRCRLLAHAWQHDELFELHEIDWGFIRPERPRDRSLAYAQAEWMLEYILETHGHDAMIELLDRHAAGVPNVRAMEEVTGQSVEEFFSAFKAWAGDQVEQWGLATSGVEPKVREVEAMTDGAKRGSRIEELLAEHPEDAGVLRLAAEHFLKLDVTDRARALLQRYAQAVPVDPWPHEQLLRLADERGESMGEEAATALAFLDQRELD
ncbi:MAG: tetratricopeptide repeat protein, partial [Phycisphaeraceae bacterium]